jgi:hypothetical protein
MKLFSLSAWLIMSPVYFAVLCFAIMFNGWDALWCIIGLHLFGGVVTSRIQMASRQMRSFGHDER